MVEDMKQKYQQEVDNLFGNDVDTTLLKEAKEDLANSLMVNLEQVMGPKYKANNKMNSKLRNASNFLFEKVGEKNIAQAKGGSLGSGGLIQSAKNLITSSIGGPEIGSQMRANIGDIGEKIPGSKYVDEFIKTYPSKKYINREDEGSYKQLINMNDPRNQQYFQESLIRMPLPRTVQEIVDNKDFVLAKLNLMAGPQIAQTAHEVIKNQPEKIESLLAGIDMMYPQIMRQDKYKRIDNKIPTKEATGVDYRELARSDIMKNSSLSYTEKIAKIQNINANDGEYDG